MSDTATEERSAPKLNGAHVASKRRGFSDDFKRAAVARVKKGEIAAAVAKDLDVSGSVVRRWVQGVDVGKPARPTKVKGVSTGPAGRKVYSEAFQRAAVARVLKGESAPQVAEQLKIHNSMLYHWRKKFAQPQKAAKGKKTIATRYPDEFKRAAVDRVRAGETAESVSRDLGISSSGIHYWVNSKKFKGAKPNALGVAFGKGGGTPDPAHLTAILVAVRDAATYLKHVKADMYALLDRGEIKEFEEYHLNTLAALKRLQSVQP